MKRIRNKIYLGLAIIGLSAPLKVHAAGQDLVTLGQDGNQVSVSLEMSNATEEKITTVAVSLEVKTEDPSQVMVDFQFAPELGGTAHGFIYHEDTGRLDIYVASSESLFNNEKLNLGNVKVQPADSGKSISADIGYCPNSFQTANGAYGNKTPVVGEIPPVSIQIGNGTLSPDSSGTSEGNSGGVHGGNGSGGSESSNRDQGLYDETTRFTNDPASAQKIEASIVKRDKVSTLLNNLSTGAASAITGRNGAIANSIGQAKAKGKVSVISPEDGPASILVSKDRDSGGNHSDSPLGEMAGDHSDGNAWTDGASSDNGSEEILLDQKNGGAVDNRKSEKRKKVMIFSAAFVGIIAITGGVIFLILKGKNRMLAGAGKKKKRKKRYRRKPTGKRKPTARRGRSASGKRKLVNRKRKRRKF